jgi:mortality factor 4-like protein 1
VRRPPDFAPDPPPEAETPAAAAPAQIPAERPAAPAAAEKPGTGGAEAPATEKAEKRKRKRAAPAAKTADAVDADAADRVRVVLPRELKDQLVSDWERVTREPRAWAPVPRDPCVAAVLDRFVAKRGEKKWRDVADAVKRYFDAALPKLLLYRYEREQWEILKTRRAGAAPSALYGAEHLLRLLAKLPTLLAKTDLGPAEAAATGAKLGELAKFLRDERGALFAAVYPLREAQLGPFGLLAAATETPAPSPPSS